MVGVPRAFFAEGAPVLRIHNLSGRPLDATCVVVPHIAGCTITFECRGGAKGNPSARNWEYMEGVLSVLHRLAAVGAVLLDAYLDTKATARLGLDHDARCLRMRAFEYPLQLSRDLDLVALRRELCAAQRPIGRSATARGAGNNTKRFSMVVEWGREGGPSNADSLALGFEAVGLQDADHDRLGSAGTGFQGRRMSPLERKAVEDHAMLRATAILAEEWDSVEDISGTHPCDLLCTRDSRQLWVEVKGTSGSPGRVMVTRNEVLLARTQHPHTALIVVHGIRIEYDGGVPRAVGGGIFIERPWSPSEERLRATQFEYECIGDVMADTRG